MTLLLYHGISESLWRVVYSYDNTLWDLDLLMGWPKRHKMKDSRRQQQSRPQDSHHQSQTSNVVDFSNHPTSTCPSLRQEDESPTTHHDKLPDSNSLPSRHSHSKYASRLGM